MKFDKKPETEAWKLNHRKSEEKVRFLRQKLKKQIQKHRFAITASKENCQIV